MEKHRQIIYRVTLQLYVQTCQLLGSYTYGVYNDIQQTVCQLDDFLPPNITCKIDFQTF